MYILLIGLLIILLFNQSTIEHMNTSNMTSLEKNAINKFKFQSRMFRHKVVKQKIYLDILKRTGQAFDELNIPFFLSSGTCLGYFRENSFLHHDYDIDIGVFSHHYTPQIVNKMEKYGFKLYRTLGKLKTGLELSFRLEGTPIGKHAKIDIFVHYIDKKNNTIHWSSYIAPQFTKKITYSVPYFDLKQVKFMGLNVNVPYPTLTYVRHHYGDKWFIPMKPKFMGGDYDYRTTPSSIVK